MKKAKIHKAYPLGRSAPLDREYLHKLPEPLYDAEWATSGCERLMFFVRPISQSTAALAVTKDFSETNLNQSGLLDYPREFQIRGFSVTLEEGVSDKDSNAIINGGYFQFVFSGRRPYLTIPLLRLMQSYPFYPFRVAELIPRGSKKKKIRNYGADDDGDLKPDEAFGVSLWWPRALKLKRPVKILVCIEGNTICQM